MWMWSRSHRRKKMLMCRYKRNIWLLSMRYRWRNIWSRSWSHNGKNMWLGSRTHKRRNMWFLIRCSFF